ncbi:uncharacterized protein LOC133525798 isoform X1 [Cydia pomonella]|uniref:uncharacterized protein LOC133525798 isoform X1 n=1 Tax=Cydia pomonella TaxID=82600 RepID=UPI002ADDFF51|nr:uncharacterized protein LOC133525798 isoform X1 [Cydia pomonella]
MPSLKSLKTKIPVKRAKEPPSVNLGDNLPEIALAAIVPSRRQKEISEFINFLLHALERNSTWLNNVLSGQPYFRCAFMLGAGPNRFQIKDIIYPSENQNVKLQIELKDSEDLDKIAIAALFKLNNSEIQKVLEYMKTKLYDNIFLKDDMLKGKSMGIQYALLRPFTDKQYRVAERIVVGTSMKCILPAHLRDDSPPKPTPVKKIKPEKRKVRERVVA